MFIVYRSNNLDTLLSIALEIIEKKPLHSVFEKEIFIHDNKILFQYLNIFFANKTGISSNFKIFHPKDFIWKLFESFLYKKKLKNTFKKSIITWKIMQIINKKKFFEHINLRGNKIIKFKFSFLMANIFEKYLFYRPNWINLWEKGKDVSMLEPNDQWQIKLWKEIMIHYHKDDSSSKYHFSNLFYFFQSLKNFKKIKKYFPNRCFIISSFALKPAYIKILKKISMYINIYFLYVTPSKNQTLKNSLMTLWGQYESYYKLYITNPKKTKVIDCFKKIKNNNNLLNNIKNNLIQDRISKKKKKIEVNDQSININICYNKKNEIEILYEKLLLLFSNNSHLKPSDIVITSFSIQDYVSWIYSIFTSFKNKKQIPFFISNQSSKKTELIVLVFKKLLNLSNSRFENKEIIELFDIPEIANHFNISKEEINILYHWIEEANIRWAIDEKHKNNLLFPENKQNTWLYGIEKLLLSYAMNDTQNIWNNVLSCSLINGSRADLIGKLITFINILKKWQKKLSKPRYLKSWRSLSKDLIDDFFFINKDIKNVVQIIQKNWTKMIDEIVCSNYKNKISIEILKKHFIYQYNYIDNKKFLPGVINFCHPSSICFIPFKIIFFIGADNKNVPKKNNLDNFNLLNKYPVIGDVDLYQQYSYLFLQNLSCAQKCFYISYVGYSVKDDSKIYPSVLIDQLLNYISLNFYLTGYKFLNIKENKKKITTHLCTTYKKEYFYKKKNIPNFIDTVENVNLKKNNTILLNSNLLNSINILDLIHFWKNPIRYFFNYHLQIQFDLKNQEIKKTEPFLVNTLDTFKIKNVLLNKIIKNEDIKKLFEYYVLSGKLPLNFFGTVFWNSKVNEMQLIAKSVNKYRTFTTEKKINVHIGKYKIKGILPEIQRTGLLRWKPTIINYSDRMALWIEHLIYSITGGFGESKIIGNKNQMWSFNSLDSNLAYNYLLQYIEGYVTSFKEPLLLIKSGASWLDQIYDIKNNFIRNDNDSKKKAHKMLLSTWTGNNYMQGEKEDFYIKNIIKKLNKKNITKICETAQVWLIPLLKNKNIKKIV
ncbi:exodeoxyribonuclease V subunit gamma [Buchnera aphidicola]|uniref:exodeoxyribonuclease V subunit gamma n=1 Tax=Buchnera aphidicola TaxID=9 RepID=UPI0034644767